MADASRALPRSRAALARTLSSGLLSKLISGFVAFVEAFAGGFAPCVVLVLGAWPKSKGISVESNKGTKTQKAARNLLIAVTWGY
jgi:hypothetical protein